MRNKIIVIFVIAAIVVVISVFLHKDEENAAHQPIESRAVPVIVSKAATRNVEYTLNQVGTLEAAQEVTIRSEAQGRVIEILFAEGGKVRQDDILVKLDSAKIQAEVRSLKARIAKLKIRLANKKRTLERNRPLVKQNLVSKDQFDSYQTAINELKAEVTQARADLSRQQVRLSDTEIRAPFDGTIGARDFSLGHYLRVGDPVLTIVDLNPLEIMFKVPEKYFTNVFIGQEVQLKIEPYPDKIFNGKIFFIAPQVEVLTRTFAVKAQVDNPDQALHPGMFARVRIIVSVHENAVTVPWESVIRTETETYVYLVDGNVAHKHPVHIGKIKDGWAEILDPDFAPGATVILEGKFAVKDGMEVDVSRKPENKNAARL